MKLITQMPDAVKEWKDFENLFDESIKNLEPGKELFIGFIDGDGLKAINDTYRHLIGTEVLFKSVEIFLRNIRQDDHLIRFGGDEFLLLLNNSSKHIINLVLERIKTQLKEDEFIKQYGGFSYSMGIVKYDTHHTLTELVDAADEAMYEAKKTKDCIIYKELE